MKRYLAGYEWDMAKDCNIIFTIFSWIVIKLFGYTASFYGSCISHYFMGRNVTMFHVATVNKDLCCINKKTLARRRKVIFRLLLSNK